jgi:hypothetical protein
MPERTIEDRLREEYFDLLPEIRRVLWQLETEIRFHTLDILHSLSPYEQLVIRSRVKDCESAVRTLRREREGRTFDPDRPGDYSMRNLPDLAGVRVLVFPRSRLLEVDDALRNVFPAWTSKPVKDARGADLAPKHFGYCQSVSSRVRGEYQVVPMLIGLFWDVEHSALYKATPSLMGIARSSEGLQLREDVENALLHFEEAFERYVQDADQPPSAT